MLVLFNKPFGVLSQFTGEAHERTLAEFIAIPEVYAAGRLDADSEGLLMLTDNGVLQAAIAGNRANVAIDLCGGCRRAYRSRNPA